MSHDVWKMFLNYLFRSHWGGHQWYITYDELNEQEINSYISLLA